MLNKELIELVEKIKNEIKPGMTIATAESCTGGMVAAYLTSVAGSSEYFSTGIVSYSNKAKIQLLNVKKETLEKFGAVSEEVAQEMAVGCMNVAKSNIAISITGIAGPRGGTDTKPIGTVCFGVASGSAVQSITCHLKGNRNQIRSKSCELALGFVISSLLSKDS